MAALPKAPNNYNPKTKYLNAYNRRNWVLKQMYRNKYIDEHYLELMKKELNVVDRYEDKFQEADYFKEEVRKQLNKILGNKSLYEEGLIIKTSLNTKLQQILDQTLVNGLIKQDKKNGWRGPIMNSQELIDLNNIGKKFINPFPIKWKILQILKQEKKILYTIDARKNNYNINLEIDENNWLINEKSKKGDIF